MYYCLVCEDDFQIKNEINDILVNFENIATKPFKISDKININEHFSNCLFILITELDSEILKNLNLLQRQLPDIPIVFYNHTLVMSNLMQTGDSLKLNIVVGENRKQVLLDLIENSLENYWRKIPFEKFAIDYKNLSPRLKKALAFIESSEINKCNMRTISSVINISPGYFSQEFRRETGQSFRSFMQKLLNYYEDLILTRVNMSTKSISELLGYSELSSFSRSFKNRKGISPEEYKRQVLSS